MASPVFGTQLYKQPGRLLALAFPWWICFGIIVTFFVVILFWTKNDEFNYEET